MGKKETKKEIAERLAREAAAKVKKQVKQTAKKLLDVEEKQGSLIVRRHRPFAPLPPPER